ncbi:MAG: c-type cytochrome [Planctomycetota bacterium]
MNPSLLKCLLAAALAATPLSISGQQGDRQGHVMTPPPADLEIPSPAPRSVEEALASFQIVEGFEVQVVAAEPMIQDPVAAAWDADGRLWVCEMLGYMPDVMANGELDPTGNIVILEDTDADGKMDQRTVFLEKIVLPRAIAFTEGGILYADQQKLYYVQIDANGNAGYWYVVDENYAGKSLTDGNVEHKANGLLYGLDNWYYNAKSSTRYARIDHRFMKKPSEFRGQWGITQDDYGRLLANGNSVFIQYELMPPNASIRNANFNFNQGNVWSRSARISTSNAVYPIRVTPGVNRGYDPSVVDHETWKLKRATAASGPVIYRANQFPESFYNNVFIPEPAGHLLKRLVIHDNGGEMPAAEQAYRDHEFLASDDERSRFVNTYVGPDGCLYILDMYRGVIQHKTYVTSFLRRQIDERGLATPLGMGRIYRVVHKDSPVDFTPPKLGSAPSADLVNHLAHPNAWWRETSQRLLVERGDRSVTHALKQMATTHDNPLARIHALWTLQGMRQLDGPTLVKAGQTDDVKIRIQVMRLAEFFAGTDQAPSLVAMMQEFFETPSWEGDLQLALSAGVLAGLDTTEAYDLLIALLQRRGGDKLFRHAAISGLQGKEAVMLARLQQAEDLPGMANLSKSLTGAMVKATERGTLTIGSLLALVDSDTFADKPAQRLGMLNTLARQAIEQQRSDVLDQLIDRMGDESARVEETRAILEGLTEAPRPGNKPIELDGQPELFAQWAQAAPEGLEDLVAKLGQTFVYEVEEVTEDVKNRIAAGQAIYFQHCIQCHGPNGEGMATQGPPIARSEWVSGNQRMVSAIVLTGAQGPITVNGVLYKAPEIQPAMAGLASTLSDQQVADVLTYIRQNFGNDSPPVDPTIVAEMRAVGAARDFLPYTPAELLQIQPAEGEIVQDVAGPSLTPPPVASALINANKGWLETKNLGMFVMFGTVTVPLALLLVLTAMMNRGRSEP